MIRVEKLHKHFGGFHAVDGASLEIRHPGQLPEGFDLARFPGGVCGLGLVRALLPRRSATLSLHQDAADVVTRVMLRPPGVRICESATITNGEYPET